MQRAELGVPAGAMEIEVDGVRLAVSREGRGPTVVCLHAIGHGGRDFEAFTATMKSRFDVIRIDWPGQGRSGEDMHHTASAARYVDLLERALTVLGVHSPIIIGNSIGGAVALLYAARAPVLGLVLCDPGGLVASNGLAQVFCTAHANFFRAGARGAPWFKAAFAAYYRLVLPGRAARAQRGRIIGAAYKIAPVLEQAWRSFATPGADIRALAESLDIPIWFAWAKGDVVIPERLCRPVIRKMHKASLTFFAGGHAAFLEEPEAFSTAFQTFAASLDSVPPPAIIAVQPRICSVR